MNLSRVRIVSVVMLVFVANLDGADWPRFRGPDGLGTSTDRGLPVTWSPQEHISWKTKLPGRGASSPITVGNRIFLTCFSGYGERTDRPGDMNALERYVVCLDRADGTLLWSRRVPSRLPEQPYQSRMHWHGYASNTPAADQERVYAFFGKSGVHAFDHDGRHLWHADVGSRIHGWGSGTSVILYQDLVIVNASTESESLIALNKRTGAEVWRAGGIKESWNTPVLVAVAGGKTELAVAIVGKVLGLDPATGDRLWTCDAIDCYIVPAMVAHNGVLYCTGGRSRETVAVRAGGRGDVTETHRLWQVNKGSNVSSLVIHEGRLYLVHDSHGIAYSIDMKTGEILYEQRLTPRPSNVYASPVIADGKLYYVSRYGRTYVLSAKPEFELLAVNDLSPDKFFNASPVVSHGQLLLRSDGHLYCIGERTRHAE